MDKEKLKEIIDPKFPILEKFRMDAPGTYKHCQNVASLCESISLELNLDLLKMNVSAIYHDIGKTVNPLYFSENQNGKNIHDDLKPDVSYQYISRHVGDTILILLQIPDFPLEIMEIISQHHGNTVLKYFYNKSNSKNDTCYRYKCQNPQTIESAVLMLADSVEATARSLFSSGKLNTMNDRRNVVNATIDNLAIDKQLDNLTYGQGRIIKSVLCKELDNIYHKRVDYPTKINDEESKET